MSVIEINAVAEWAMEDKCNMEALYAFLRYPDEKSSTNALWALSHLPKSASGWLRLKQDDFVDMLLAETHTCKKRMLLQLLMKQSYDRDSIRADFLDYCLSKINAECEPYAIRCYSIYCALKMCRFYPELMAELDEYIAMLSTRSLSPGLQCALRRAKDRRIKRLNFSNGKD